MATGITNDQWTDKKLARLGEATFIVILQGKYGEKFLGSSSPNAALTLFAHVMTFAKGCYNFTEDQGLICLKAFCHNLVMACPGLNIPNDAINGMIHKVMNSPELSLQIVDAILDPALDYINDDKLFPIEPLDLIKD